VVSPHDEDWDLYSYVIRFIDAEGNPHLDGNWGALEWGIARIDGPDPLASPTIEEFEEPAGPWVPS